MRLAVVVGLFGRMLRVFAVAFLVPLGLALADSDGSAALHFAVGFGTCAASGVVLGLLHRPGPALRRGETLLVVTSTWFLVPVFAGVPFLLDGLSATDSYFEAMSALTTTGATIVTDFSRHGRAFFLWRAFMQWIGGYGVVALFVFVLPQLAIGGRQLFFAEVSSAPGATLSPQVRRSARGIATFYVLATAVEVVLLQMSGMKVYDSILHGMATLSSGGLSPNPLSLAGYGNPAAEWIVTAFMLVAGMSFTLQWMALTGRRGDIFRDPEHRIYLLAFLLATVAVSFLVAGGVPGADTVRGAAFSVASLLSTTGFSSVDYDLWNDAARVILMAVLVLGGCGGSSGGGAKVVRYVILGRFLGREMRQALHPAAVLPVRWNGQAVPSQVLRAVVAVVVLFALGYAVVGGTLVLLGTDLASGFTAAMACLNNAGPGLGEVGPYGTYGRLPDSCKWVLSFAMALGRLEVLTVLVVMHPRAWKGLRWRDLEARPPG